MSTVWQVSGPDGPGTRAVRVQVLLQVEIDSGSEAAAGLVAQDVVTAALAASLPDAFDVIVQAVQVSRANNEITRSWLPWWDRRTRWDARAGLPITHRYPERVIIP